MHVYHHEGCQRNNALTWWNRVMTLKQIQTHEQNLTSDILIMTKNRFHVSSTLPIRPSCGGLINDSLGRVFGWKTRQKHHKSLFICLLLSIFILHVLKCLKLSVHKLYRRKKTGDEIMKITFLNRLLLSSSMFSLLQEGSLCYGSNIKVFFMQLLFTECSFCTP